MLRSKGAGGLLGIGLIFAFVTASGAIGATMRALEAINETRQAATWVRSNLTRLWLTVALMALLLIAFTALLVAGPLFGSLADSAGIGDAGRTAVQLLRYPVGLGALLAALLLLYTLGPADTRRRPSSTCPALCSRPRSGCWPRSASPSTSPSSQLRQDLRHPGRRDRAADLDLRRHVAILLGALFNPELRRVR